MGKLIGDVPHELFGELVVVRIVVMELYEQHPFASVGVAEHEVSKQALLCPYIIECHAYLLGVTLYLVADLIVQVVHEPAFAYGINLVESTRDMETNGGVVALCQVEAIVVKLLFGKPSAIATAKLQLVAIFFRLDRSEYRANLGQLNLAYACQLVGDLRLFCL